MSVFDKYYFDSHFCEKNDDLCNYNDEIDNMDMDMDMNMDMDMDMDMYIDMNMDI